MQLSKPDPVPVPLHRLSCWWLCIGKATVLASVALFAAIGWTQQEHAWASSNPSKAGTTAVLRQKAEFSLAPRDASVVKWAPDGNQLAVGGLINDAIWVFDIRTQKQAMVLKKNMPGSLGLAWSPDGRYIAAGNAGTRNFKEQKSVHIWDAKSGALVTSIIGPFTPGNGGENDPRSLAFSPDSRYLAVDYTGRIGKGGAFIYIYDVSTWAVVRSFGDIKTGFSTSPVVFSPDGRHLAEGSHLGEIRIWNNSSGKLDKVIKAHTYFVTSLAYSPDGKRIASGTVTGGSYGELNKDTGAFKMIKLEDPPVIIWDVETGKLIKTLEKAVDRIETSSVKVRTLAFSQDGKYLASVSYDKKVRLWDTSTWRLVTTVTVPDIPMSMGLSPNGRYLAAGAGNRVLIWEMTK